MLDPPKIKRKSIEGEVTLKRKSHWVKRYAKVEKCVFSYTQSQNDNKIRFQADLRTCKVKLGQLDNK